MTTKKIFFRLRTVFSLLHDSPWAKGRISKLFHVRTCFYMVSRRVEYHVVFETKFSDQDVFHDLRNHDILYPMVLASS